LSMLSSTLINAPIYAIVVRLFLYCRTFAHSTLACGSMVLAVRSFILVV
jgi:hypothetical protein